MVRPRKILEDNLTDEDQKLHALLSDGYTPHVQRVSDRLFLINDDPVTTELIEYCATHELKTEDLKPDVMSISLDRVCMPSSVIRCDRPEIDEKFLTSRILLFNSDQEFLLDFWDNVVFKLSPGTSVNQFQITPGAKGLLRQLPCKNVYLLSTPIAAETLPEGPYFLHNTSLFQTWRFFPDTYEAFQLPTIQNARQSLTETPTFTGITYTHAGKLMVPVPSRLHFPKTSEKPLNGVRVTLKDIINLKGVKTTAQCRAYEKLYRPATVTAPTVTKLLELGAVLVGKTKCTQFASSDQPTSDWIDYHCPWNPRGDGYLSPRGSSTGPSVAVGGYDWLDLGLGTDTGGSIRGPASVMGLFALRPSISLSDMSGIIPIAKSMDTTGLVCRDAELLNSVGRLLYDDPFTNLPVLSPIKLLYPLDYWNQWPDDASQDLHKSFVRKLERFLNVEKSEVILADEWRKTNPSEDNETLEEYLKTPFMNLLWRGYYDSLLPFCQDHKTSIGHRPYLHPTVQHCYDRGSVLSYEEIKESLHRKDIYTTWLRSLVSPSTIMVYPVGDAQPFYRDDYRRPPQEALPYNWNEREDHQASLAGFPAMVVPVGQAPFLSKITGKTQFLPVAISLMSSPGTDSDLTKLTHDFLTASNLPSRVNPGQHTF